MSDDEECVMCGRESHDPIHTEDFLADYHEFATATLANRLKALARLYIRETKDLLLEAAEAADRWPDNPEWDGTDGAHPAYWRGEKAGGASVCKTIAATLDGDIAGKSREDLQAVRDRLIEQLSIKPGRKATYGIEEVIPEPWEDAGNKRVKLRLIVEGEPVGPWCCILSGSAQAVDDYMAGLVTLGELVVRREGR